MPLEKKNTAGGGMDMDTDERFVAGNDYRKAVNCRIATSDEDSLGTVENVRSNRLALHQPYPDSHGNKTVIGSKEDVDAKNIVYFVHDDEGYHGIYMWDYTAESWGIILEDNPGSPILNFDKDYLITGINIVGSDEDIFPMGLLYWSDDLNPPRKINIYKAINNLYTGAIDEQTIDAIKYPPYRELACSNFKTDTTIRSNFLKSKSWQFKYRYVYDDLEKSAWSPISNSHADESFNSVYNLTGADSFENNVLPLYFNTGHHTVNRIQIAARNTNGVDDFFLIADLDKKNLTEPVTSSVPLNFAGLSSLTLFSTLGDNNTSIYLFYNNGVYNSIDVIESSKLYDDIPHQAKAQEIVDGNRMVYGNVVSGQTADVIPDVSFTPEEAADISSFNTSNEIELDGQFKIKDQWTDASSMKRRFSYQVQLIFKIIPMATNASAQIYTIEVENLTFAGGRGHPGAGNTYVNRAYDHKHYATLSVGYLNVDYNSTAFPAGSTVTDIANNLAAQLNSTPGAYEVKMLNGDSTYTNINYEQWDRWVSSSGTTYLRWTLQTNTTSRYYWTNAGSNQIHHTTRFGSADSSWERWSDWAPMGDYGWTHGYSTKGNAYGSSFCVIGQNIPGDILYRTTSDDIVLKTDPSNRLYNQANNNGWDTYGYWPINIYDKGFSSSEISDFNEIYPHDYNPANNRSAFEFVTPDPDYKNIEPGFKTGATHKFGLVYYDRGNRSSSVILPKNTDVYIPKTSESLHNGTWQIDWEINHTPPNWATHYQWVYSGNTLTNDFIQFVSDGIFNGSECAYDSGEEDSSGNAIPEGTYMNNYLVDITNIHQFSIAEGGEVVHYTYKKGDIIRFVLDDLDAPSPLEYEFKVVGVVGQGEHPSIIPKDKLSSANQTNYPNQDDFKDREFLLIAKESVLTVPTGAAPSPLPYFDYTLEIYSPISHREEDERFYYEFGHVGKIGTDTNGVKIHKRITGSGQNQSNVSSLPAKGSFIEGDIYWRRRHSKSNKMFTVVEAFDYSDKFKSNYWNKGRPNIVLKDFKRSRKHSTCLYSEPYIPNTNINGLSAILPDVNFVEFERSYNSIQKLHSKNNELIIFQEDKTSRAMVKRDIIYNVDGSGNVATSDRVISQAIPYLGDYGICTNPESFASFANRMYFVDARRGSVLRLSTDGLTPISEYKMKDFFTDKFSYINNNINDVDLKIHGVYDAKYNEYIMSIEDVQIWRRGGVLDTILEQTTLGFSESRNRWNSFYTFDGLEGMCDMNIGFVSFKNGELWMHDEGGGGNTGTAIHYNNFYGDDVPSNLWLISNEAPSNNKVYKAFSQESTRIWEVEFETKEGQQSTLVTSNFDTRENIHYSDILNDVNSPGGIIEGDRIRSTSLLAKLTLPIVGGSGISKLFAVNFNLFPSHRSNK